MSKVNAQGLQLNDKFTYLGSTLSRAVHIDNEVIVTIATSSVALGSSFPTDGHKAIRSKLNSKSKTNRKRTNIDN